MRACRRDRGTGVQRVFALAEWPERDRRAWAEALSPGDGFDGTGAGAHWTTGSRRSISCGYGRWIGFLNEHEPAALPLLPQDRVTPERIGQFIRILRDQVQSGGVANYVKHLYDAIRVMAPDHDWRWLRRIKSGLEKRVVRKTKRERMVSVERILEHAETLMNTADLTAPLGNVRGPVQYRDGLILAVLATRPMRRRNLAALRLGSTLLRTDGGYVVAFGPDETKNKRPYTVGLPDWLVPHMDRYIDAVRVRFPKHDLLDHVWLTADGTPVREQGLYDQIARRTRKAFGQAMNLHLFRDIAVTTSVHAGGHAAKAVSTLIHHASQRTSHAHYNQARGIEAADRYQDIVERMREAARARAGESRRGAPCVR